MAAPTRISRRRALGPRDVNTFPTPLKQYDDDTNPDTARKRYSGASSRRSIGRLDDGRISKAGRYVDKRVGVEHRLEGRVADGNPLENNMRTEDQFRTQDAQEDTQESLLNSGGTPTFSENELQPSGCIGDRDLSTSTHLPHCPAATTLRLRLRMALFKVQTNQTAVPISHLQLPQQSPQPLSVFPPTLVRVSAPSEAHDQYYDDYGDYGDGDITTSPPPSSPPPLPGAIRYTSRGIPFPTPIRSSSPSPSYGKPLDIGSSSDSHGTSSYRCSSC